MLVKELEKEILNLKALEKIQLVEKISTCAGGNNSL